MLLGLEDVEQVAAAGEAEQDESIPDGRAGRARKRRSNRGAWPVHLPRVEIVVDIDDNTCPCCKGELHRIGEDRSERLDMVPAQFRVLVTRRPKYACRSCEDGIMQTAAPARLIEGGLPTEATVAQVLVSKYADHLPLYRQAQIYARQGIDLDRSTLANWVGHAAWHLRPLHERLLGKLRHRPKLFADETTLPVLDPGRGLTKTGQLWAYTAEIGHGAAPIRQASSTFMHLTAKPSGRSPISQASRGSCRSTAMPAMPSWPSAAPLSLRSAGRICGATSTNSQRLARADCERGAEAHRRIVRHREGYKRPQRRGASPHSPPEKPAACRDIRAVAARKARSDQPEGQTRRRHPLCALALAGPDALHR
jgi:transposase